MWGCRFGFQRSVFGHSWSDNTPPRIVADAQWWGWLQPASTRLRALFHRSFPRASFGYGVFQPFASHHRILFSVSAGASSMALKFIAMLIFYSWRRKLAATC